MRGVSKELTTWFTMQLFDLRRDDRLTITHTGRREGKNIIQIEGSRKAEGEKEDWDCEETLYVKSLASC